MSSLRGDPGARSSLPATVDMLAEAARQSGRPGLIWLAGLAYQSVVLGWSFGIAVALPVLRQGLPGLEVERLGLVVRPLPAFEPLIEWVRREGLAVVIVAIPVALPLFRLACGLARVAPAAIWEAARRGTRSPRLRLTWREGRGTTWAGVFLWLQFLLMMFGATLLFVGPAKLLAYFVGLHEWNLVAAIFTGVLIGLLLVYSLMLSILYQLALHSLVQNRRGVGSALLHAWRLAKNDPMATVRAALLDAVLTFTILALHVALIAVLGGTPPTAVLAGLLAVALYGFGGCTRGAFWARAYRSLGGLSTLEGAPG